MMAKDEVVERSLLEIAGRVLNFAEAAGSMARKLEGVLLLPVREDGPPPASSKPEIVQGYLLAIESELDELNCMLERLFTRTKPGSEPGGPGA